MDSRALSGPLLIGECQLSLVRKLRFLEVLRDGTRFTYITLSINVDKKAYYARSSVSGKRHASLIRIA